MLPCSPSMAVRGEGPPAFAPHINMVLRALGEGGVEENSKATQTAARRQRGCPKTVQRRQYFRRGGARRTEGGAVVLVRDRAFYRNRMLIAAHLRRPKQLPDPRLDPASPARVANRQKRYPGPEHHNTYRAGTCYRPGESLIADLEAAALTAADATRSKILPI
jgi:hypothetical protein